MKFNYILLSIILSFLFCTVTNSLSINKDDDISHHGGLKYTGYDAGGSTASGTTNSYTGYTSANSDNSQDSTTTTTPSPTPTPSKSSSTTGSSTGTTMSGTGIYSTGKTSNGDDGSYSGIINSGGWSGSGEIYTGSNSFSDYSSSSGGSGSSSQDSGNWSSVAQFVLGFAEGLEMDLSKNSKLCFATVNSSIDNIETAFQLIEQGFLNVSKSMIEKGFKNFGVGLIELPAVYELCGVKSFISEIKSLALKLSTGEGVITVVVKEAINIYFNDNSLTVEFKSAVGDFRSNNYFYFGINTGKIVGILLKD